MVIPLDSHENLKIIEKFQFKSRRISNYERLLDPFELTPVEPHHELTHKVEDVLEQANTLKPDIGDIGRHDL